MEARICWHKTQINILFFQLFSFMSIKYLLLIFLEEKKKRTETQNSHKNTKQWNTPSMKSHVISKRKIPRRTKCSQLHVRVVQCLKYRFNSSNLISQSDPKNPNKALQSFTSVVTVTIKATSPDDVMVNKIKCDSCDQVHLPSW